MDGQPRIRVTALRLATLALASCSVISACTGDFRGGPTSLNGPSGAFFQLDVSPSQIVMQKGGSVRLSARVGAASGNLMLFTSSDPQVAQLIGRDVVSGGGLETLVFGASPGKATITVKFDGDGVTPAMSATVPVTVELDKTAYNGTWVGDVSLSGAFCPGTNPKYKETIEISVAKDGTGSLTATDTPSFVRAYAIVIPDSLAFTARGAFTYFGTAIPGEIGVAIDDEKKLFYQETTAYGGCSNTFVGTLTKQ